MSEIKPDKTVCEFLEKADYEGGLWEMILGYGVLENDFKGSSLEPLIAPIKKLKEAATELEELLPILDDCEECEDCHE